MQLAMRKKSLWIVIPLAALGLAAAAPSPAPEIQTGDVDRFYRLYDAAGGAPTAAQLQRDYLDRGSPGLARFAKMRRITGERIAEANAKTPGLYVEARACAAALPGIRSRLADALGRFAEIYPQASMRPVTITIGRGKPVGVADAEGVMIGLEALCAAHSLNPDIADRFVYVIAHEYVHVEQSVIGLPEDGMTVLHAALAEGGAEFIGELISGSVAYRHLIAATRGREAEMEAAFRVDIDKPAEGSRWLYNGLGTADWPGDLGYWVGYRIAKAYYRNAADKRAAIRDIIAMEDPHALLAASGWKPGIVLD